MKDLVQKIEIYKPWNEHESLHQNRLKKFVLGNPHCFESVHPPKRGSEKADHWGHITGSAWVLSPDKNSVLLTHHKKLNKWLQLGGHSDGESDVLKTALREAFEESGISEIKPLSEEIFDIDIHLFPQKKEVPAHLHYDVRFCLIAEHENYVVSNESNNLSWVPVETILLEDFEPSLKRMAAKTKEYFQS